MKLSVFISSVQKELAEERRALKDFILGDPLLRRFIDDVFLFEDIPAGDRSPDDIYLAEVENRDLYVAILAMPTAGRTTTAYPRPSWSSIMPRRRGANA